VRQSFTNVAEQQATDCRQNPSAAAQAMIGFLKSRILRNSNLPLDIDTPLISSGLVDSFAVLELLQELETVTNRRISPADVAPADLDTVEKMLRTAERFSKRK
jgi:acyl carrier protein